MTKALLALLMISSISATFADDANPAPKPETTEEAGQAPAPNNNPQG